MAAATAVVIAAMAVPWLAGPASASTAGPASASTTAPAQPHPTGADQTLPASNQVLAGSPSRLVVVPTSSPAAGGRPGTAKVVDSAGHRVAAGPLVPTDGAAFAMNLPHLARGPYLVGWSAGGRSGSFAFDVAGAGRSPSLVVTAEPPPTLAPLADNVVEWVPLVAVMVFVGALALRFLVSAPAARRSKVSVLLDRSDRRLVRIAAVAVVVFVPTTVLQMAYDDGSFAFGALWQSFGADGDGYVEVARLALTAVAAVLVVSQVFRRRPSVAVLAAAAGAGLAELALREVPTAIKPDMARTVFTAVVYVLHLWAAAIWIGGLVGLLGLAVPAVARGRPGQAFWAVTIRRFSAVATVSVGVLVLSGLWLSWVHVASVSQLFTTLYGRTLVVKLIVAAVLVGIGGFNQLWLLPRMDRKLASDGADNGAIDRADGGRNPVVGHLRTTVAVEVVLALAVLFIAPLLGGSARTQAFQAGADVLGQTTAVDGRSVELAPSGLQPGLVDYTVTLDGPGAAAAEGTAAGAAAEGTTGGDSHKVTVTFADPKLGLPPQRAVAVAVGDGMYRVAGYYTPVVGDWRVAVRVDGGPPATFTLPVAAEPAELPKAPTPTVRWTTWLAGVLETALVVAVLYTTYRVSRRLAATGGGSLPAPDAGTGAGRSTRTSGPQGAGVG